MLELVSEDLEEVDGERSRHGERGGSEKRLLLLEGPAPGRVPRGLVVGLRHGDDQRSRLTDANADWLVC